MGRLLLFTLKKGARFAMASATTAFGSLCNSKQRDLVLVTHSYGVCVCMCEYVCLLAVA